MKIDLAISGTAMLTPIGLDAERCLHAVRTAISRLAVVDYPDISGEYLTGARIYTWTWKVRAKRLQELAERAILEAWHAAISDRDRHRFDRVGILLGVPESIRPGYRFPHQPLDVRQWATELGLPPGPVEVIAGGACSAQLAIHKAAGWLDAGEVQACIVGAVDTQLDIEVIRWHEHHYRLKTAYLTDGFMPGEAACFFVLENVREAANRGARILASVQSTVSIREEATVLSDRPNTAAGLTQAVRTTLSDAGVDAKNLEMVWCDQNGESYRAREWAYAEMRVGVTEHTELRHPADCHGDLGAATDANLLMLAAMAQESGWSHGRPQLVYASSEGGIRAATIIGPPTGESGRNRTLQVTEAEPRTLMTGHIVAQLAPDEVDPADSEDPPRTFFEWQLRQERLEELASLYYQRCTALRDPELEWPRVGEPEQRLLNHVDAVVVDGPKSIWAVASGLLAEEEGLCFGGALILAVLPNPKNLDQLEAALTKPPAPRLRAVEEALRHARPIGFLQRLTTWLEHPEITVRAMAISLLGELRLGEASLVYRFLESTEPLLVRRAVQALRRRRDIYSLSQIERVVRHGDPLVVYEAALAALCLGSQSISEVCRELCRQGASPETRAPFLLSMCGQFWDVELLQHSSPTPSRASSELLSALGILGYPNAVDYLLTALRAEVDSIKVAAAEALDLITGAGLREEAVVPEPDEPALTIEVVRVCTDWQRWSNWWSKHASGFKMASRFRLGKPFDLAMCVHELSDPHTPLDRRQRAYWELQIHGGQDIPYEPDWFVVRQRRAIDQWRAVVKRR